MRSRNLEPTSEDDEAAPPAPPASSSQPGPSSQPDASPKRTLEEKEGKGERVEFSDDEDSAVVIPKKTRTKTEKPAARLMVASASTINGMVRDARDKFETVNLFSLNYEAAAKVSGGATLHQTQDADGYSYTLGQFGAEDDSALNLGLSEIVGLVSVANDIVEILIGSPDEAVIVMDPTGKNFARFTAGLAMALLRKCNPAVASASGVRVTAPQHPLLKEALEKAKRSASALTMRGDLDSFYKAKMC